MERKEYILTLAILASYGFFKELRPSEPYLTEYLIDDKYEIGLAKEDVYTKVYPIWPYSYFGLLIPVFLLTDFLKYKPVIVFEGLAYIGTWALLLWARTLLAMQFMQFIYGVATSTEVAYYTYIYAKVPKEDFKRVSSYTRSAILFGKFGSGLMSQLLTTFDVVDYRGLNYIAFSSVCVALVFSVLLPSVKSSIYFHKNNQDPETNIPKSEHRKWRNRPSFKGVLNILLNDAKIAYGNSYVVKWSLWVVISTCVNYQVGNYIQPLWEEVKPSTEGKNFGFDFQNSTLPSSTEAPNSDDNEIFNGAVEAAATLLGAINVFAVGFVSVNWVKWGDFAIIIVAGLSAFLLYLLSITGEIWVAYVGYLLYRMAYQVLMTVATVEIVKDLPRDSYGLIFGANLFAALGCQTVLTWVVNSALELNIQLQFEIYAIILLVPAFGYTAFALIKIVMLSKRNNPAKFT